MTRLFHLRTTWTAASLPLTREEIEVGICGFLVTLACLGVFS